MGGEWEQLADEVRVRPMRARPPRTDEAVAEHATLLVREGLYSKAAQSLEQAPMAAGRRPLRKPTLPWRRSTLMVLPLVPCPSPQGLAEVVALPIITVVGISTKSKSSHA